MATYQIHINERTLLGKSILALLKSAVEAVSFDIRTTKKVAVEKSDIYKNLESGFRDVREILDGRQKKQTLKEFLDEL
ncbi:hypothetical protein FACS1894199_11920 [Bacteroidia bacterium]|nr:hypothetical protein FACS1894199_11920 [Bacteroidia bacterium]